METSHEDSESFGEKVLSNGDIYGGNFAGTFPYGPGKYVWVDGTVYEGEWDKGKMTGRGRICWPSGAVYEGELQGGCMHGYGTFIGRDGSVYEGFWRMNIKHGLGTKTYPNSDIYEGLWGEGVREGLGKFTWSNGNVYTGNWKAGKMSGRGVMKWTNGDLFDGGWLNGVEHGPGFYKSSDDTYFFGTWSKGLKDGRGTFYPAGSKLPVQLKGYESTVYDYRSHSLSHPFLHSKDVENVNASPTRSVFDKLKISNFCRQSRQVSHRTASREEVLGIGEFYATGSIPPQGVDDQNEDIGVYDREYVQGVLVMERVRINKTEISSKLHHEVPRKPAKGPGKTIYKGHKSYYLMLNLQLGIRYTVGKITPVHTREVRPSDFGPRARIKMFFPRKGSQFTPPHYSIDFYWKDYCPMVFRNLREMFKIDAADYMMSICGGDGLKELSSPGKSGSIFYLSNDERFVIKTLRKHELKVLLRMLPQYYNHVGLYENTLITKFFGVHRITIKGGRKVRFVVMGNMFYTELHIHRRYDLKGSTQGRSTNKNNINENTTLKDLDLPYAFHMNKSWREALFRQISLDSRFLESQCIIDYSMLLGVHFRAPQHLKNHVESKAALQNIPSSSTSDVALQDDVTNPPKSLLLVTHEPNTTNSIPGSHIRGSKLRASVAGDEEVDLLLPEAGRLPVQLGVNMPAQAYQKLLHKDADPNSTEIDALKVNDVVLYLGIIDILQEYNLKKKIEHAVKSLKYDSLTISAVEPKLYSKRFIGFLERVFPEHI